MPGELAPVGGIDGAGADGKVMAVEGDIAPADIENGGDQGGAVEVLPPVLIENIRFVVGENLDPLPHCHALFEVLLFDLVDADRTNRALGELETLLHRLFIAAALAGDFARDGELHLLGWIERIFQ